MLGAHPSGVQRRVDDMLQCVAVCCSVMQCVAGQKRVDEEAGERGLGGAGAQARVGGRERVKGEGSRGKGVTMRLRR